MMLENETLPRPGIAKSNPRARSVVRSTDAITTSICTCCTPPIWRALMTLFAVPPTGAVHEAGDDVRVLRAGHVAADDDAVADAGEHLDVRRGNPALDDGAEQREIRFHEHFILERREVPLLNRSIDVCPPAFPTRNNRFGLSRSGRAPSTASFAITIPVGGVFRSFRLERYRSAEGYDQNPSFRVHLDGRRGFRVRLGLSAVDGCH